MSNPHTKSIAPVNLPGREGWHVASAFEFMLALFRMRVASCRYDLQPVIETCDQPLPHKSLGAKITFADQCFAHTMPASASGKRMLWHTNMSNHTMGLAKVP